MGTLQAAQPPTDFNTDHGQLPIAVVNEEADWAALRALALLWLCSEEDELRFFAVFNQAVAHVVQELGVLSLQVREGLIAGRARAACPG